MILTFYPDPFFDVDLHEVAAAIDMHYHKFILGMVITPYTVVVKTSVVLQRDWVAHNTCQITQEFYVDHT